MQIQRHLSCIGSRQEEQAVDSGRHLLILGLDLFQHVPVVRGLLELRQRPVDLQVDNGERRTQFMAGIGGELRLAFEGGLQARQHVIKGGSQFAELVPALQMQAAAQIGRVNLVGRACNHLHRSQRFARQPVASNGSNDERSGAVKEPDHQ